MRARSSKVVRRSARRISRMDIKGLQAYMDRYDRIRKVQERALSAFVDWKKFPLLHRKIVDRVPRYRLLSAGRYTSYYAEVHHWLTSVLGNMRGKRILHVGSGIPYYGEFLRAMGAKGTALDISPRAAKAARAIGFKHMIRGDAVHLPVRTNSMDAVLSDHFVLANYLRLRGKSISIMNELHRVLRTGGIALFTEMEFQEAAKMGEMEYLSTPEGQTNWETIIFRPSTWKVDRGAWMILRKK